MSGTYLSIDSWKDGACIEHHWRASGTLLASKVGVCEYCEHDGEKGLWDGACGYSVELLKHDQ